MNLFRCDVSGDEQLDLTELANFLSASVEIYCRNIFTVDPLIFSSS